LSGRLGAGVEGAGVIVGAISVLLAAAKDCRALTDAAGAGVDRARVVVLAIGGRLTAGRSGRLRVHTTDRWIAFVDCAGDVVIAIEFGVQAALQRRASVRCAFVAIAAIFRRIHAALAALTRASRTVIAVITGVQDMGARTVGDVAGVERALIFVRAVLGRGRASSLRIAVIDRARVTVIAERRPSGTFSGPTDIRADIDRHLDVAASVNLSGGVGGGLDLLVCPTGGQQQAQQGSAQRG